MGKEKTKVKFSYCDYCEKEIDNPTRKPLDEMEKTIITIVFISTIDQISAPNFSKTSIASLEYPGYFSPIILTPPFCF